MGKPKKKFDFVRMFLRKNNIKAKPYITQDGESIQGLAGNTPRLVATTNRGDRKFLGDNVISTTQNG